MGVTKVRKLLNVLYVTSPGSYLARDGDNVVVRNDEVDRFRVPILNLEGIVTFGYQGASPALMALCAERGVALTFLSENGRFLARVSGGVSGNVLLRRRQYRAADSEKESAELAYCFIAAKVANCRTVLLRALRDHGEAIEAGQVDTAADGLARELHRLGAYMPLDGLRGVEGETARTYFGVLDHLILVNKQEFFIRDRNRRPPRDNMNALLSFLYTLLAHDTQAALETVGLDPQVGFLHRDRPGRPGLALDLMEGLRPFMADRLALSLVNRQQVSPAGFRRVESGAVLMDDATRKAVIEAWQKRKQEEIIHPFLGERVPVGLIPYVEAILLARYLRGDLDGYPPFFWK